MRFATLEAWLAWQAGLNPRGIALGLERVREVWRALGPPPLTTPVLTVAGTNGKGSSVAYAEAILQAAGYVTGCYTSPHLLRYNERVRIDRRPVDDAALCTAFAAVDDARGEIPLTYFEFGTLAALWLFTASANRRQPLDALVLEVGLGGRLDAVNLVDPDVALITAIGLDHQAWLGDDVERIGAEKAGILRPGRPAVFSGAQMPVSIGRRADAIGAPLRVAGRDYRVLRRPTSWDLLSDDGVRHALPLPGMRGALQLDNAAGVIVALDCLRERLPIDQRAVRSGLLEARLPGRFEVHPGQPTWVLDVAHNPQAAAALDTLLGELAVGGRRLAVCGVLDDKDAVAIAQALAQRFDAWWLVDLSAQPRGRDSRGLAAELGPVLGDRPLVAGGDVATTLDAVAAAARPDDLVVVFGSFLVVGPAMAWLEAVTQARTAGPKPV